MPEKDAVAVAGERRRDYSPPVVNKVGSLADLTQGSKSASAHDFFNGTDQFGS